MRTIKDPTEAEEMKRRCKNTEKKKMYRKGLNDPDNHNGVAKILFSLAPKSLLMVAIAMKLRDTCSSKENL